MGYIISSIQYFSENTLFPMRVPLSPGAVAGKVGEGNQLPLSGTEH